VTVRLAGVVGSIVVQTRHSPLFWLGPLLISAAHATADRLTPVTASMPAARARLWTAVAVAWYGWLRRDPRDRPGPPVTRDRRDRP
jgi:hypothetical protein